MNIGFAVGSIFVAHSLYKTPRKLVQCVMAWLGVAIYWIGASALLDLWLLGQPALPGLTHERICMFIGPAAAVVYRYLFPQLSVWNCVFTYFMVGNCLILMLLFARTLSEVLAAVLALPLDATTLTLYLTLTAAFLLLYHLRLRPMIRRSLAGFLGSDMRLLALFAVLAYFGTLFVTDVWGPWPALTFQSAMHNFSAVLVPLCGYGVAFLLSSDRMRIKRLERTVGYDALTGLKNRSRLGRDAKAMLAAGYGPLHLLVLDMDSFKRVNDTFGHIVGDEYLRSFARSAVEALGGDGEMYRVGGDEFVVLYHGKSVDGLCQRLRAGFQGENCPEFYGISIGRAVLRTVDQLEAALNEADLVMYEEKMSRKQTDPEDALPAL